jgi:hypothetical protein
MKTKNLIMKYYRAIRAKDIELEKKLYTKITKKSLKGKRTQAIR